MRFLHLVLIVFSLFLFQSCGQDNLVDSNVSVENKAWSYHETAVSEIEIKDVTKSYNVCFKIRNTADYRYSNLYAIFKLKGNGLNLKSRYQFKLAQADGIWTGKGSGDLYTNEFVLLKNYQFPKAGKYQLEIEQNMRDNPLAGVSDIGIRVSSNR